MDFWGSFFRAMLPIQSVFEWNRFLDFYAILLHRISSLLRAKREPEGRRCPQGMKAPVGLFKRRPVCKANAACSARQGLRYFRGAGGGGCGSLRLLRALRGTRILQAAAQQLLPVSAAGRGRRRCKLRAARLNNPKADGSIQKIQVAALEDFLCCADFKSLTRRTVWQGCVFFLAKIMICKLFMNY